MTTIFLDTEFTGLTQDTQLLSLALLTDDEQSFYAEFTDYDAALLSAWHHEHVLPYLRLQAGTSITTQAKWEVAGDTPTVTRAVSAWLEQYEQIEIWADCPAYDWVLFCQLFGGALQLPKHIFYLPFDLVTLFKAKGLDPDTDRRAFASLDKQRAGPQHNALVDAQVTRACYQRLMTL